MAGTSGRSQSRSERASTRNRSAQLKEKPKPTAKYQGAQTLLQKPAVKTTAETFTPTTQVLNAEQSIQIMQTLLHGCLSSVLFQRSIFPPNCYETRYYMNNSTQWTYKDYLGAEQGVIKGNGAGGSVVALKKGISGRVDRFLDLLEMGVFDALHRSFLKSMRLSIFENVDHPDDILESWTITVHYVDTDPAGGRLASGFDLEERQGARVTLGEAKLSLNDFIRKLTGLCLTLPALPEEKNLVFEIVYTDNRPDDYFAPGFPHPVHDNARFPSNDEWGPVTSDVALMSTSHHAASLRVSHLRSLDPSSANVIPSSLACSKETGKLDDIMSDLGERAEAVLRNRSMTKNTKPAKPSQGSCVDDVEDVEIDELPLDLLPASAQISPSSKGPRRRPVPGSPRSLSSNTINDLMRPSTADQVEQEQLRNMLRPAVIVSNTQATQPAFADPRTSNRDSTPRLIFSQMKVDQADRDRDATFPPRKEMTQIRTAFQHMDELTVRCECGHQEEEGDMVECEFCRTYQHLHCHGYRGKEDVRVPTIHMCYPCLLEGEDTPLQQVRNQTVYRRAIWLLQHNSFDDTKSFAKFLHCAKNEADSLVKKFRAEGLLTISLGSFKKGKQAIALSNSQTVQEVIRRVYFDPSFGISHHLESSTILETPGKVKKRVRRDADDGELLAGRKRMAAASGAVAINGSEINTPKAGRRNY